MYIYGERESIEKKTEGEVKDLGEVPQAALPAVYMYIYAHIYVYKHIMYTYMYICIYTYREKEMSFTLARCLESPCQLYIYVYIHTYIYTQIYLNV